MTTSPRSGFFESQRLRLHYTEWGDPAAPPLILQHGGKDHARSWDRVVADFLPDWWIIAPDLRGHGDSAWSVEGIYGLDYYLCDFAKLFDALEIESATVIGHSLGGNIALRHAAVQPDRVNKLVVIEGLGRSPAQMDALAGAPIVGRLAKWIDGRSKALVRRRRIYETIDAAYTRLRAAHPHFAPDLARHLTETGIEPVEGGYCFKADPALSVTPPFDLSQTERQAMWHAVRCETLLVYGADSWASNPLLDGRSAHFTNARTEIVAQAGHWLHHDKPAEFIALLRGFL